MTLQIFHDGLAEILEISPAELTTELELSQYNWDSMAVISTIALCDEIFNVVLDGRALTKCETVADIDNLISQARKA